MGRAEDVISTGDPVKFRDANSSRLRPGGRFSYVVNEYVSLARPMSMNSAVRPRPLTYGYNTDSPKLTGVTGIGELGLALRPFKDLPLSFDLVVQGYVGKREGVTGSLQVRYESYEAQSTKNNRPAQAPVLFPGDTRQADSCKNSARDGAKTSRVLQCIFSVQPRTVRCKMNLLQESLFSCRLPGFTLCQQTQIGAWRSPAAHLLWEQGVARSIRAAPTRIIPANPARGVAL